MTGISNFACLTQFRNVCRMFTIIQYNALDYYIGTNMTSDGGVHATRNATHFKLQLIKHRRTSEELCLQLKGIKTVMIYPIKLLHFNTFIYLKSILLNSYTIVFKIILRQSLNISVFVNFKSTAMFTLKDYKKILLASFLHLLCSANVHNFVTCFYACMFC